MDKKKLIEIIKNDNKHINQIKDYNLVKEIIIELVLENYTNLNSYILNLNINTSFVKNYLKDRVLTIKQKNDITLFYSQLPDYDNFKKLEQDFLQLNDKEKEVFANNYLYKTILDNNLNDTLNILKCFDYNKKSNLIVKTINSILQNSNILFLKKYIETSFLETFNDEELIKFMNKNEVKNNDYFKQSNYYLKAKMLENISIEDKDKDKNKIKRKI